MLTFLRSAILALALTVSSSSAWASSLYCHYQHVESQKSFSGVVDVLKEVDMGHTYCQQWAEKWAENNGKSDLGTCKLVRCENFR